MVARASPPGIAAFASPAATFFSLRAGREASREVRRPHCLRQEAARRAGREKPKLLAVATAAVVASAAAASRQGGFGTGAALEAVALPRVRRRRRRQLGSVDSSDSSQSVGCPPKAVATIAGPGADAAAGSSRVPLLPPRLVLVRHGAWALAGRCWPTILARRPPLPPPPRGGAAVAAPPEEAPAKEAKGRQHTRTAWRALLIVLYIICDISVYVVGDRATHGYTKQTVLFASAFTSVIIGSLASFVRHGQSGIRGCFEPGNVLRLLPVSACFILSQLALLKAFPYFDGAFIKLLGQMKLPLTAGLSALLLGRRYSVVQWQIIFLICVACTSFTAIRLGGVQVGPSPLLGLPIISAWVVLNVLATIFSERALKGTDALPFTTLMTNMRIGEAASMLVMLVLMEGFRVQHFFVGWDATTLAVLATLLGDAWLSGLMVKQLSSVTTKLAKCCSMVVLYLIALASGKQAFVMAQALGAMIIVQSTALFVTVSTQQEASQRTARAA